MSDIVLFGTGAIVRRVLGKGNRAGPERQAESSGLS